MPDRWLEYATERLQQLRPAFTLSREFVSPDQLARLISFSDPPESYQMVIEAGVVTSLAGDASPCIAVLGEGGSGKSVALWRQSREANDRGEKVLGYNLAEWQAEALLQHSLLNNDVLSEFLRTPGPRYFVLDGLDESQAALNVVPIALPQALANADWNGLRVHIGSQPVPALDILARRLQGVELNRRHILPLTRAQIRDAAEEARVDSRLFLVALDNAGVTSLATRPLPLILLLDEFRRLGGLASSQAALHEQYIETICAETPGRAVAGAFTPRQRRAIARRIAAVTAFGNYPTMRMAAQPAGSPRELSSDACVGGSESVDGHDFEVSRNAVEETLDTGLFYRPSAGRVIWSPLAFRDYLAASWISEHHFNPAQVTGLISTGEPRRLIPSLFGVASWLAVLIPGVIEELLLTDPEVALFGAALDAAHQHAEAVVAALLTPRVARRLVEQRPFDSSLFGRLGHESLTEQLRPALALTNEDQNLMLLALLIVRGARTTGLEDELVALAIDLAQPRRIRGAALAALRDVADATTRCRVRELLPFEEEWDLIGLLLQVLWPDCISAEELFGVLPERKPDNAFTSLDLFVGHYLAQQLRVEDLPAAVAWCTHIEGPAELPITYENAVDAITSKAGDHLDQPEVRAALYALIEKRWQTGWPRRMPLSVAASLEANTDARRELYSTALASDRAAIACMEILGLGRQAVSDDDIEWLAEQATATANEDVSNAVGFVLRHIAEWYDNAAERVFAVREAMPGMARQLAVLFDPVPLSSRPPVQQQAAPEQPQMAQLASMLSRMLASPPDDAVRDWEDVVQLFMRSSGESIPGGAIVLTDLWKATDLAERRRLAERAMAYLEEVRPPARWYTSSTIPGTVLLGQSALLLAGAGVAVLAGLSPAARRSWIPAALTTISNTREELDDVEELCVTWRDLDGEAFLNAVADVIEAEARRFNSIPALGRLDACWDSELSARLLQVAQEADLSVGALSEILRTCIARGDSAARTFAATLLDDSSKDEAARGRALAAARALLAAPDGSWDLIWPVIQRDLEFGRVLLTQSAQDLMAIDLGLGHKLGEQALAELYEWLVDAFPDREEDGKERGRIFGAADMSFLRSAILEALGQRGSREACDAIEGLKARNPGQAWWDAVLERARAVMRTATWDGIEPRELIQLAADATRHVVNDGADLLRVVREALRRIQLVMTGEHPLSQLLWNEFGQSREDAGRRPKEEQALSDFLAALLNIDLVGRAVIVNREVQIRRKKTDIYVSAAAPTKTDGVFDIVTVAVEVKGCWNRDLDTAMKDQLVDRYMRDTPCEHGMYVVGWFYCEAWTDETRKTACRVTKEELEEALSRQAAELSVDGRMLEAFVLDARWPF